MAQKYWPDDHWPTDYWPTDYWIGANSADVIGTIGTTLDDFVATTDFDDARYWPTNYWPTNYWPEAYWGQAARGWQGSFYIPAGINAQIQTTLGNFTSSLVGSTVHVDFFDISVNFGITWLEQTFDAATGDINPTMADFTSSLIGTAGGVGGVVGTIATTLADHSPSFLGTFVAPANETGVITTTLEDFPTYWEGGAFAAGSALGNITTTLEDFGSYWEGAHVVPTYAFAWASTLDNVTADNWRGATYTGGVSLFKLDTTLADFTSQIVGVHDAEHQRYGSTSGDVNSQRQRVGGVSRVRVSSRSGKRRA